MAGTDNMVCLVRVGFRMKAVDQFMTINNPSFWKAKVFCQPVFDSADFPLITIDNRAAKKSTISNSETTTTTNNDVCFCCYRAKNGRKKNHSRPMLRWSQTNYLYFTGVEQKLPTKQQSAFEHCEKILLLP